eukprot:gene8834-8611_t
MNIYAPRGGASKVPVMLWIHGGSLEAGSGMDPSFNGSRLVESHGADGTTLANNGYRDQREAMRW